MSLKILVTGNSGFLGKYILRYFKNYNVHSLGRTHGDYIIDIKNRFSPLPFFNLVIHSAGKAHVYPKTSNEIDEFFQINYIGTKNLLESLTNNPPEKFVFISTVAVYGLISGNLISENAPLLANDPYGKSKILAEEIVKTWCKKYKVVCTILRLPLLVGANPPGNLGSMIKAIQTGYYFNISGGSAKKSMILASDVSNFILKASEIGGTYNLTDGYHPSFSELSLSIADQIGKKYIFNMPISFAKILAFFGDIIGSKFPINSNYLKKITSTLTFDDSKARNAFGWNPSNVLKGFRIHE